MRVLYIGRACPSKHTSYPTFSGHSLADNKAENALIESLLGCYAGRLTVFSAAAYAPASEREWTAEGLEVQTLDSGVKALCVGHRRSGSGVLSKCFSLFREAYTVTRRVIAWIRCARRQNPTQAFAIIVFTPHLALSLGALLGKLFYRVPFFIFLVAAPVRPEASGLRRLWDHFSLLPLRCCDGAITYVPRAAQDYTRKPFFQLLYTLTEKDMAAARAAKPTKPLDPCGLVRLAYTGALVERTGVLLMLETMRLLPARYTLTICGNGELAGQVRRAQQEMPDRLHYRGAVTNQEAMRAQREADILLSLRPTEGKDNAYYATYAASGKLTEYLLSGVPVVANRIPAIPEELACFLELTQECAPQAVADAIQRIATEPAAHVEALERAAAGQRYIIEHATIQAQGRLLAAFLARVHTKADRRSHQGDSMC